MADPLAVYGAVVGTAAAAGAVWNIYHGWWRDRARVELGINVGSGPIVGYGTHTVDPREYVYIAITNRGRRPVSVESAGLLNRDGSSLAMTQDPLGQQVFRAVLDERNPTAEVSARTRGLRERYSATGQSPPTHIFCRIAGKRVTRRLSRKWVHFLTSTPVASSDQSLDDAAGQTSERPAR